MGVTFAVLGPVTAADPTGSAVALRGPRHREVLARLLVARGRLVPLERLVGDLWDDPPAGAVPAVRTFVAALRRALEPGRPARTASALLVTEGSGYALRPEPDAVDAWRFERRLAEAGGSAPREVLDLLTDALGRWRGPAYADLGERDWLRGERARLAELRSVAVERLAAARLALGLAVDAVADLDAHVAEQPGREEGWRLLALALYRSGRQGDALAVLRRARTRLHDELGRRPGPGLAALERDVLQQAEHLSPRAAGGEAWSRAATAYGRTVAPGAKARLETTVTLLRSLAVSGADGLVAARQQRLAGIDAAEQLGDVRTTARVIGSYDVPSVWTRSDDPEQATLVTAAAERTLARLPEDGHLGTRARLLATIAVEQRGRRGPRGPEAARAAEQLARRLDDPRLLAFALDAVYLQTCDRAGRAAERDAVGRELVELAVRHELTDQEVLGHLVRMQARGALGDLAGADDHADAVDRLAAEHERPLATVLTVGYRAMRRAAAGAPTEEAEAGYRTAAAQLRAAGMPGVADGLLPLALLCLRVGRDLPAGHDLPVPVAPAAKWGPYEPWARPHLLLAAGRGREAATALRRVPEPEPGLLLEALWVLTARAAVTLGDRPVMLRARTALAPAAAELAGAGSGLLTAGPVSAHLAALDAALGTASS